jgi:excisionase family DNA binding protein
MEKLLTADEVAECLRLNRETVLRKARRGEIPAIKMGYRSYRFYKDQIDDWLKEKAALETKEIKLTKPKNTKGLNLPTYNMGLIKGSLSRREIYKDL